MEIDLQFYGILAESLLKDLSLDHLEDGGRVDGEEALVVVQEVQVDVELGLAGGAGLNFQFLVDFLQLGADDGGFVLVGLEAKAGFTNQTVDELFGVLAVNGESHQLGEPRSHGDGAAAVVVRGDEGLEAGEVDGLGQVTQTGLLGVTGLLVV